MVEAVGVERVMMPGVDPIGIIGAGKMGGQIALGLAEQGFEVMLTDHDPDLLQVVASKHELITGLSHREAVIEQLGERAVALLSIPSKYTGSEITALAALDAMHGGVIIDAGNSNYKDTIARGRECDNRGVALIDAGFSGGAHAQERGGFPIMIGGPVEEVNFVFPLFRALASDNGLGAKHLGPTGAGHYVKMHHNGAEYGMMAAIAESLEAMRNGPFPELDLAEVTDVYSRGSIIAGHLMDDTHAVLVRDPSLETLSGVVAATGEGGWALDDAIESGSSHLTLAAAIKLRNLSQSGQISYATSIMEGQRMEFGGHPPGNQAQQK